MTIRETAPAKINLALHVTGQRSDGYHTLETLVTFSADGDVIEVAPSREDGFSMSGRFSVGLSREAGGSDGNLVLRARDAVREALAEGGIVTSPVSIALEKNLPIASGIGGGSADAAATIRALLRHWNATLSAESLDRLSLSLGADIPMCLAGRPLIASGVGEDITLLSDMPSFSMILANPLHPVSTPQVFRTLENRNNSGLGAVPALSSASEWIDWIASLRNDLEPPARKLTSSIGELSGLMQDSGARLVRMSGSGASCFALYDDGEAAAAALTKLIDARPEWYFMFTQTAAGG